MSSGTSFPQGGHILVPLPETIHLRQTCEEVIVDRPGNPKLLAELLAVVVGLAVFAGVQQAVPWALGSVPLPQVTLAEDVLLGWPPALILPRLHRPPPSPAMPSWVAGDADLSN